MSERELVSYPEAQQLTGLPLRTLQDRIARCRIPTYIDGRDNRRRLIDRSDLAKLLATHAVIRPEIYSEAELLNPK